MRFAHLLSTVFLIIAILAFLSFAIATESLNILGEYDSSQLVESRIVEQAYAFLGPLAFLLVFENSMFEIYNLSIDLFLISLALSFIIFVLTYLSERKAKAILQIVKISSAISSLILFCYASLVKLLFEGPLLSKLSINLEREIISRLLETNFKFSIVSAFLLFVLMILIIAYMQKYEKRPYEKRVKSLRDIGHTVEI
ncbi:hypothetical protein DRN74_04255 [Candidatus Micrarchaeota archaeon]|nr:MAG: hypothetical protein DRN74_04255 [Candidatus Micrarchaeota archaeon]